MSKSTINRARVDRELYIVVCGPDGTILADGVNKARIGTNRLDAKDPDGKAFIKERVELAKEHASFWQSYKYLNPHQTLSRHRCIASGWTRRQSVVALRVDTRLRASKASSVCLAA